MWVVAAIIVAALMYVSSLERLRDFAVLKSLGSSSGLLFLGVAAQAVAITLLAAAFAVVASQLLKPMFALPIEIPASAFVVLPVVAIVVGLLSSLVALRRAISVDPSSAFAAAHERRSRSATSRSSSPPVGTSCGPWTDSPSTPTTASSSSSSGRPAAGRRPSSPAWPGC